jgi:membrane protein implicated in regulation of membrane protease activity
MCDKKTKYNSTGPQQGHLNMNDLPIWWWLAGALLAIELLTGSFYLLMLALGAVAAALAAHAGLAFSWQITLAAVVGTAAVVFWHLRRARQAPSQASVQANTDVLLDVGERVFVTAWQNDGTTTVHYRGAQWQAVLDAGARAHSGAHRVAALQGNRLVLHPVEEQGR